MKMIKRTLRERYRPQAIVTLTLLFIVFLLTGACVSRPTLSNEKTSEQASSPTPVVTLPEMTKTTYLLTPKDGFREQMVGFLHFQLDWRTHGF